MAAMFRYHHFHHGWGWGILGFVVPLLFWVALIGLVVLLVTRFMHPPPAPAGFPGWRPPVDSAIEQARFRYARGEITRDEYFRIVADLGGAPVGAPPGSPPPGPPPPGDAPPPPS